MQQSLGVGAGGVQFQGLEVDVESAARFVAAQADIERQRGKGCTTQRKSSQGRQGLKTVGFDQFPTNSEHYQEAIPQDQR